MILLRYAVQAVLLMSFCCSGGDGIEGFYQEAPQAATQLSDGVQTT
jgi:hypothetical protein